MEEEIRLWKTTEDAIKIAGNETTLLRVKREGARKRELDFGIFETNTRERERGGRLI